jgi:hypothetical protein
MGRTHDPPTPEEGAPMSEPSAGPDLGGPPPQPALEWSPELQQDVLDPVLSQICFFERFGFCKPLNF